MIVENQPEVVDDRERLGKSDLDSQITQIINMYGYKDKITNIYLHAPMDSITGFKIELKFTISYFIVKGFLLYSNGRPISVPELYRQFILRKFQQCTEIPMQFQYSKEIGSLIFQSSMKLGDEVVNRIPLLVEHVKSVIGQLPRIYQQLSNFGIVKKINLQHYKLIKNKLNLIQSIIKTLRNQQPQKQAGSSSNVQSVQSRKGSVFRFYKQIEQMQQQNKIKNQQQQSINQCINQNLKSGGYFQIQKRLCRITKNNLDHSGQVKFMTHLAVKKLRKDKEKVQNCQNKLKKQLRILCEIQNPCHTLTYWLKHNESTNCLDMNDKIYMEYIEETLDDCIYGRQNSIEDILTFSKQIIKAVDILHKSGVVHRDLKPDNILVQSTKSTNTSQKNHIIKLIDFGESSLRKDAYSKKVGDILGSTLPYSPIECYISCQEAFNSPKIDLWSVGLILHEIYNKKNPISYSRCFSTEIYLGWTTTEEFSIYPNLRNKNGIKIISMAFAILTLNSVSIKQDQRISLYQMEKIIGQIHNFLTKVEEL